MKFDDPSLWKLRELFLEAEWNEGGRDPEIVEPIKTMIMLDLELRVRRLEYLAGLRPYPW